MWNDNTAAITTVACDVTVSRTSTALPLTTGTILSKQSLDTNLGSSAFVILRGGASADGTNNAITASAGTFLFRNFIGRLHTAIGQSQMYGAINLLDDFSSNLYTNDFQTIKIQPNEGILVQVLNTTTASNAATNHYMVTCMWDEVKR